MSTRWNREADPEARQRPYDQGRIGGRGGLRKMAVRRRSIPGMTDSDTPVPSTHADRGSVVPPRRPRAAVEAVFERFLVDRDPRHARGTVIDDAIGDVRMEHHLDRAGRAVSSRVSARLQDRPSQLEVPELDLVDPDDGPWNPENLLADHQLSRPAHRAPGPIHAKRLAEAQRPIAAFTNRVAYPMELHSDSWRITLGTQENVDLLQRDARLGSCPPEVLSESPDIRRLAKDVAAFSQREMGATSRDPPRRNEFPHDGILEHPGG